MRMSMTNHFEVLKKLQRYSNYPHWSYEGGVFSIDNLDRDDQAWARNLLARITDKPTAIQNGPEAHEGEEWLSISAEHLNVTKLDNALARESRSRSV